MKKYYLVNFCKVDVKIYVGEFENDRCFWNYFEENKKGITEKQEKLTPGDKLYFMSRLD